VLQKVRAFVFPSLLPNSLVFLHLILVFLSHPKVRDRDVDHALTVLAEYTKNIVILALGRSQPTSFCSDETLKFCALLFQKLRALNLSNCTAVSAEGLAPLLISSPSVHWLNLSHCDQITDAALDHLPFCMTTLCLDYCWQLTDEGLGMIARHSPNLRYLSLFGCAQITDEGLFDLFLFALHRLALAFFLSSFSGLRRISGCLFPRLLSLPCFECRSVCSFLWL
jgi:hypothetical protein